MRIAINALSAKCGGGMVYLNRLIFYLRQIDKQNDYYIFVTHLNKNKIVNFDDKHFHIIETKITNLTQRLLYEQFVIPFFIYKNKIDILYSPAGITTFLAPCKTILGIQDANVFYKTKIQRNPKVRVKLLVQKILAKFSSHKACRIVFVSETARKDIAKILKIKDKKTKTIYHGVETKNFNHPKKYPYSPKIPVTQKYILSISNLSEHKNYEALIKAYAKLDTNLSKKYKLIIVGEKMQPYYDKLQNLVSKYNLQNNIIFLGKIAHAYIPSLYGQASLFALPSILETFGLPLIEAMASGCPVVASHITCIPEICRDAAVYFNPLDAKDIANKIGFVLNSNKLKNSLIKKGKKRAKNFTWEKTAQKTLKLFEEVNQGL